MGKYDTLYVAEIKFILLQRKSLPIILVRFFSNSNKYIITIY